ncbi:MAG: dihydroorotate dehydrogenase (quinone) [Halobacteriovorax sp.]|nr:dihydroorotate dehydrogenase (quinone) [Halobacteriovorax sp.]
MSNFIREASYKIFKTAAFQMDPEFIHEHSMDFLGKFPSVASKIFGDVEFNDRFALDIGGTKWPFPIGLAAGLDKNAMAIDFFSRLPLGAVEVGTVTPKPQAGNDKPRLFRYVGEESLRNRMGFNNDGAKVLLDRIEKSNRNGRILGVNLGKNKVTEPEKACEDYASLYETFSKVADYLVVNVSSPNTPGLRDLQGEEEMNKIFDALKPLREKSPVPLYLKIAPDLSEEGIRSLIEISKNHRLNGLIATNTTIMEERGPGGISGKLLTEKSRKVRNQILEALKETPEIELIGVGGVSSSKELFEFWKNGGKAMQVYTAFIFQGPSLLHGIYRDIDKLIKRNNAQNLRQLLSDREAIDWT